METLMDQPTQIAMDMTQLDEIDVPFPATFLRRIFRRSIRSLATMTILRRIDEELEPDDELEEE
jgi:hypothetical protein